jgi:hypothetical protein
LISTPLHEKDEEFLKTLETMTYHDFFDWLTKQILDVQTEHETVIDRMYYFLGTYYTMYQEKQIYQYHIQLRFVSIDE